MVQSRIVSDGNMHDFADLPIDSANLSFQLHKIYYMHSPLHKKNSSNVSPIPLFVTNVTLFISRDT